MSFFHIKPYVAALVASETINANAGYRAELAVEHIVLYFFHTHARTVLLFWFMLNIEQQAHQILYTSPLALAPRQA